MQFATQHAATQAALTATEQAQSDGKDYVSSPLVMASAAGWYVGQICTEASDCDGLIMPWDRLSGYFPTAEAAIEFYDYDFEEEVFCDVCGVNYPVEDQCEFH